MQVELTLLPQFNTQKYLTFIERCGGIEGFFHEKTRACSTLLKEYQLSFSDERKSALKSAEEELKNPCAPVPLSRTVQILRPEFRELSGCGTEASPTSFPF